MIPASAELVLLADIARTYVIIYHALQAFPIESDQDTVISPVTAHMLQILVIPLYHARLKAWMYPNFAVIGSKLDTIKISAAKRLSVGSAYPPNCLSASFGSPEL